MAKRGSGTGQTPGPRPSGAKVTAKTPGSAGSGGRGIAMPGSGGKTPTRVK